MKKLILELRKKKPKFKRTDSNKYKFKNKWRAPRGLQNKQRLKRKGHVKQPSVGYGSPASIKYLDSITGLKHVTVSNFKELENIDTKTEIVLIGKKIGTKKKIELLKKCQELKLDVFNVKDTVEYLSSVDKSMKDKKEFKKKVIEKKKKDREEVLKKKEGKASEKKGKKEEEIKKEVTEAKPKEVKEIIEKKQKDTTQAKSGHSRSSVPGTKQ